MSINYVDFQEWAGSRITSPKSYTMTNGAWKPIMIVFVMVNAAGGAWSSATYAGESLTKLVEEGSYQIWYRLDPQRGTNDLAFTWNSGSGSSDSLIHLYTFENVKEWRDGSTGVGKCPSCSNKTVSCEIGDMMIFGCDIPGALSDPFFATNNQNDTKGDGLATMYGEAATSPDDIGWDTIVGSPDVRRMFGALVPAQGSRGVLVI